MGRRAESIACVLAASLSCSKPHPSSLTIGIEGGGLGHYVQSLHVTTTVAGTKQSDVVVLGSQGTVLPREVDVIAKRAPAKAEVRVEGFATDDPAASQPVIVRTLEMTLLPWMGRKLVRLGLEPTCVTHPPPGGLAGPSCSGAGQTCIHGACASDVVGAEHVEDYTADWAQKTPDACRPANAGPPVVIVGNGQNDYLPLKDNQLLQAQAGPQGGHHIWIAVRMHNLKQSGSTTTVTATEPESGTVVAPYAVVFTFRPDEGGFCKLNGLRFQLDANGVDLKHFLGKPLDVTVTVRDVLGEVGVGKMRVQVDRTILPL